MPVLTNPQYEMCCQARANGKNVSDSYAAGGFARTASSASNFFRRPEIRARVVEILTERAALHERAAVKAVNRLSLTKEWVIERLMHLAERSLYGEPVKGRDGLPIPGKFKGKMNGASAARALELLGNTLGIFVQRHEIGAPGDFAKLTDEELVEKIAEDARALGLKHVPDEVLRAMAERRGSTEQ